MNPINSNWSAHVRFAHFGPAHFGGAVGRSETVSEANFEGSRSITSIDTLCVDGLQLPLGGPSGSVNSARLMTNALYNFNWFNWQPIGSEISPKSALASATPARRNSLRQFGGVFV